ncbi:hypothetical protein LR48_Vigan07g205300 [Vigna angularis]|uniref:Uncharacterized protein n=1 Tax=Phaseolus angularis TaxID=3914 RepID=A0A0L9V0R3_PHAAN|nr:hypothetical protein LR48_Vigan07g205300 [Vigna angularis]
MTSRPMWQGYLFGRMWSKFTLGLKVSTLFLPFNPFCAIRNNWPTPIIDTILKAQRYHVYNLAYATLGSKICEYKGVNIIGENSTRVLPTHEIGENNLKQMGFILPENIFVHKEDSQNDDDEDVEPINVARPSNVGPSYDPSLSSFSMEEHLVDLTHQMEQMENLQQSRHEEFVELQSAQHDRLCRLLNYLDARLKNIESHYDLNPNDSPSVDF